MKIKILPLLLVVIGLVLRLLPHPVNFAPISAIALFSGVYLPKKWNLVLPLLVLLLTDYFLGFYGALMIFTYGAYALIALWGQILKKFKIEGPIGASLIFFLVSNFGFWAVSNIYSHNLGGLITCFLAGLPFLKQTLVSDFLYTAGLFIGYAIIKYVVQNLSRHYLYLAKLV